MFMFLFLYPFLRVSPFLCVLLVFVSVSFLQLLRLYFLRVFLTHPDLPCDRLQYSEERHFLFGWTKSITGHLREIKLKDEQMYTYERIHGNRSVECTDTIPLCVHVSERAKFEGCYFSKKKKNIDDEEEGENPTIYHKRTV